MHKKKKSLEYNRLQINSIFTGHTVARDGRLRYCATSQEVARSIPDGVTGNFHWHNPSGRTKALRLTQPLMDMSTRNISWRVKAASAYSWQPYYFRVPTILKSGSPNLLELSGPLQGCNRISVPFTGHVDTCFFDIQGTVHRHIFF